MYPVDQGRAALKPRSGSCARSANVKKSGIKSARKSAANKSLLHDCVDICMVLSSLYEFSTRRFAAPAESGGEASAFILLDVKSAHFSPFGEKTASSALRLNPHGLFCAKRTTIFAEDGILHTGGESAAFVPPLYTLLRKSRAAGRNPARSSIDRGKCAPYNEN